MCILEYDTVGVRKKEKKEENAAVMRRGLAVSITPSISDTLLPLGWSYNVDHVQYNHRGVSLAKGVMNDDQNSLTRER